MASSSSAATSSSSSASAALPSSECWDSISYLESAFHHGFMRSRLKTGDFVYYENARLTRELDEFCDADAMHQSRGPIILMGESGVGKTAFLANWLVRRKKMFQNSQSNSSYPEFIFHHVVGCSRQSLFVANLLERILRELKEYFELNKEIPDVEERLSWQLPRFLEAAAKKGRIILIVDGLQRLRTTDGESILKWVPLAFPPNVRLIFSGTVSSWSTKFLPFASKSQGQSIAAAAVPPEVAEATTARPGVQTLDQLERAHVNAQMIERIKLEANRRNWLMVTVSPLIEEERLRVVKKFIHKHHPLRGHPVTKASSVPGQSESPSQPQAQSKPVDKLGGAALLANHGLQLFDLQQRALVSVALAASPVFLKTFLTAVAWAVNEGFSVHVLFQSWLGGIESHAQLIEAVLRSMEMGFTPDAQGTEDARQFLAENRPTRGGGGGGGGSSANLYDHGQGNGGGGEGGGDNCTDWDSHTGTLRRQRSLSSTAKPIVDREMADSVLQARLRDVSARRPTVELRELNFDHITPTEPAIPLDHDHELSRANSLHETAEIYMHTTSVRNEVVPQWPLPHDLTPPDSSPTSSPLPSSSSSALTLRRASSQSTGEGIPIRHSSSSTRTTTTTTAASSTATTDVPSSNPRRASASGPGSGLHLQSLLAHAAPPAYLTGGLVVAPLGPLLGRALSLLYVCRHGLTLHELKFILNAVVTEERASNRLMFPRQSLLGSLKSAAPATAFTETEWMALLRALKAVGVLSVQEVLVLPICKETLRDVVWWRYLGSERAEQSAHQWLIRFFRIHPTTFRRVEELPWHLRRCYQWEALRNVLVSLPMFRLLYTATHKVELFAYWRLLSEGPLPLFSTGASSHTGNNSASGNGSANGNSNGSSGEPMTGASASTPGEPLVYATPFDIVREYGRSVDDWYRHAKPTTKVFTAMLQLVTKFMHEFAMYYQGFLPVFAHAPFELTRLYQDGFTFTEDLPHVQSFTILSAATANTANANTANTTTNAANTINANATSTTSSASSTAMTASTASSASVTLAAMEAFPNLNQSCALHVVPKDKESNGNWFYFYQRWIWIHFPWLALGREIAVRDAPPEVVAPRRGHGQSNGGEGKAMGLGMSLSNGGSDLVMVGGNTGSSDATAATSTLAEPTDEGNDSLSDDTALLLLTEGSAMAKTPAGGGTVGSLGTAGVAGSALGPTSSPSSYVSTVALPTSLTSHPRAQQLDSRFWDVKRSLLDSTRAKPRGTMSPAKLRGLQNASIGSGSTVSDPGTSTSTSAIHAPESLPLAQLSTEQLISPENLFRKKATYAAVKNVLSSSVRALPGTTVLGASSSSPALSLASIPEHDSATATAMALAMAVGLPTTADAHANANAHGNANGPAAIKEHAFLTECGDHPGENPASPLLTIDASREPSVKTRPSLGSMPMGMPLATSTSQLDQLTGLDTVASLSTAFGLPAHFQDYPQSEWDLRRSYNYELVLKLQTLLDAARLEVKKKQSHYQDVTRKIADTSRRYEAAMRDCEMARQAVEEMNARLAQIEAMIRAIERQERAQRKLLRGCELFPPSNPSHSEHGKKTLRLLQMKLKDLGEERKVLARKQAHLQTVEMPVLRREVDRNKQLVGAVVHKLERARDKLAQDQAATGKLHQRRLEMIEDVRQGGKSGQSDGHADADAGSVGGDAGGGAGGGSSSLSGASSVPGSPATTSLAAAAASPSTHLMDGNAATRSLAAKVALQQCESMCDKIQKATGYSKLDLILEKFVSREELNRSFEEQAKVYESRLKQIKMHHAELEQQLNALELSNAATHTEDPRVLEERVRVAEVELARTERTQGTLLTTSKEVITGVARIAKLLGITSCRMPHQHAVPAAQLWPPPVDMDSTLVSEVDTLEAKEIAVLLQICQERALSMIDVVENGRGDPDANFVATFDFPSKGGRRAGRGARGSEEPTGRSRSRISSQHGIRRPERGSLLLSGYPMPTGAGNNGSHYYPHHQEMDVVAAMREPPDTPELDGDDSDLAVLTRDVIKSSSKARLALKKPRGMRDRDRDRDMHAYMPVGSTHALDLDGE